MMELYGEHANLRGFWPDFDALESKAAAGK